MGGENGGEDGQSGEIGKGRGEEWREEQGGAGRRGE